MPTGEFSLLSFAQHLFLILLIISFNGWGVTRDDALDTMLLMNLTDMFDRAMLGVKDLTFDMNEVCVWLFFRCDFGQGAPPWLRFLLCPT